MTTTYCAQAATELLRILASTLSRERELPTIDELETILDSEEGRVYLNRHGRITGGKWTARTWASEVRELCRGGVDQDSYLRAWSPLRTIDPDVLLATHAECLASLPENPAMRRAEAILRRRPGESDWTVYLFPDGQCGGYGRGPRVLVDIIQLWLGNESLEQFERSVAASFFASIAAHRWSAWSKLHASAMTRPADALALSILGRLVHHGVAMRCLREAPSALPVDRRDAWDERRRRLGEPVTALVQVLDGLADPDVDDACLRETLTELGSGVFSGFQVLGAELVDLLLDSERDVLPSLVQDPRHLPGLLVERGVSPKLARWCLLLGAPNKRSSQLEVPICRPVGSPPRWEHPIAGDTATDVCVAVAAGSTSDPRGQEGLAHVVEHAIVDRMAKVMPEPFVVHGTTEAEATLFTFRLENRHRRYWDELIAAVLDPCPTSDVDVMRLTAEVMPEVDHLAHHARARLRAALETRLLGPPFGRLLVGTPESVRALDADAITSFHRRWYRPEHVAIAAVGRALPVPRNRGQDVAPAAVTPWPPKESTDSSAKVAGGGRWMLGAHVDAQREVAVALVILVAVWRDVLQERFGSGVEVSLSGRGPSSVLEVFVDEGVDLRPASLVETLEDARVRLPDRAIERGIAEEAARTDDLRYDSELLVLWLASRAVFRADEPADFSAHSKAVSSLSVSRIREVWRDVLSRPTAIASEPASVAILDHQESSRNARGEA